MAYTSIAGDSAETAQERAIITKDRSAAIRSGEVQRITYLDRTVEVPTIDHAALGRPVDKQFERNKQSVETRLRAIGVLTATVVNCLPLLLVSDSTLHPLKPTQARIPAPKDVQDYATFIFADAHIEPTRQGIDSPLIAWEYHPIELAGEFSRLYPKGVMTFIGIPSDLLDPAFLAKKSPEVQHHGKTYGQILEETKAGAVEWMQANLNAGNEDDRLRRNPAPKAKASARRLKALNLIAEMPNWVEKQKDVSVRIPNCPNCQKPCEPGAATCTNGNCNFIIDPKKAYEIGAIAEDHPALERLTRKEVTEMGISDYVAETREEKQERLKTPGAKKPLSEAAQRIQETEDEVRAGERQEFAETVGEKVADVVKPALKGKNKSEDKD